MPWIWNFAWLPWAGRAQAQPPVLAQLTRAPLSACALPNAPERHAPVYRASDQIDEVRARIAVKYWL